MCTNCNRTTVGQQTKGDQSTAQYGALSNLPGCPCYKSVTLGEESTSSPRIILLMLYLSELVALCSQQGNM
jgi:hypothetical protein